MELDHAREEGRGGLTPALDVGFSKGLALGGGLYLAVDLPYKGLAVLAVLLELAHLLELISGKAVDPLGDLVHGQRVVVGGPERAIDGGPELGLVGGLLGLACGLLG